MVENVKETQKKLVEIEAEIDTLGVQVSDKSIKTSVRNLTIKVHPDRPLQARILLLILSDFLTWYNNDFYIGKVGKGSLFCIGIHCRDILWIWMLMMMLGHGENLPDTFPFLQLTTHGIERA